MSLINTLQSSSQIKLTVADLFATTSQAHSSLLASWEHGIDLIWASESPAAVLAEMGSGAAGIVAAHTATVAFLETFRAGSTTEKMMLVQPYTIHEDGTVTVD